MMPNPGVKPLLQPIMEMINAPGQTGADNPDLGRAVNDLIKSVNALSMFVSEMDKRIVDMHDALIMPHTAHPPQPHSLGNQISLNLPVLNRTRGDVRAVEDLIKALAYSLGEEHYQALQSKLQLSAPQAPIQGVDADTANAFPNAFA